MKETLHPQHTITDPEFSASEAAQWPVPNPEDRTNIIEIAELELAMPSIEVQVNQAQELHRQYLLREDEPGRLGYADLLNNNLAVLERAVKGDYIHRTERTSDLFLQSYDQIALSSLETGRPAEEINLEQEARWVHGTVPEATNEMVADIYALTGALIMRDDRTYQPGQAIGAEKPDRRYRVGEFRGKRLLFIEDADIRPSDGIPYFHIRVTDDFGPLTYISKEEYASVRDHTPPGVQLTHKANLPGLRDLIKTVDNF